jgi:ADP-ribose pyrophosphatase YjhB (NUDIX family)
MQGSNKGRKAMEEQQGFAQKLVKWLMQRWFRLSRSLTLGVRAAVFNELGQVYLIRHTYVPGWHMPGGGVEKGQTLMQALAAELIQEAGIEMLGDPELFAIYSNHSSFPNDHVALYIVRDFNKTHTVAGTQEIAEGGFFALDALPDGVTAATRERLREIEAGLRPAATWKP